MLRELVQAIAQRPDGLTAHALAEVWMGIGALVTTSLVFLARNT